MYRQNVRHYPINVKIKIKNYMYRRLIKSMLFVRGGGGGGGVGGGGVGGGGSGLTPRCSSPQFRLNLLVDRRGQLRAKAMFEFLID